MNKETPKEEAQRMRDESHREEEKPTCEKYMKEIERAVNKVNTLIEDYYIFLDEELNLDKLRKENEAFKRNNPEIPYDMPECDTN